MEIGREAEKDIWRMDGTDGKIDHR